MTRIDVIMTRIDVIRMRNANRKTAEDAGLVADSHEARLAIVARIHSGEITLEQGQSELKALQRNAKKNGKVTRQQAYMGRTS